MLWHPNSSHSRFAMSGAEREPPARRVSRAAPPNDQFTAMVLGDCACRIPRTKRFPSRIVRGTPGATWRWDWSCRELAGTRPRLANFLLIRSDIRLPSRDHVDFIGPRRRWLGCAGDASHTDRDLPVARPLPARCDSYQHAAETKYKRPIALKRVGKDIRLIEVVYRACR
jgi:hypothetical protein